MLSLDKATEIKQLCDRQPSDREVSRRSGVSRLTVAAIRSGEWFVRFAQRAPLRCKSPKSVAAKNNYTTRCACGATVITTTLRNGVCIACNAFPGGIR